MKSSIDWSVSMRAWAALLLACPRAHFFHTPGWYQAHAESLGYRPMPAVVRFESGRWALLPLATRRTFRGLGLVAHMGLENGYGGLISPEPLTEAEVELAFELVRARFPDLVAVGDPHAEGPDLAPGAAQVLDETQVLPLVSPEEQLKAFSTTRAKHVRRARREGFHLEVVPRPSPALVEAIYPLYEAHADRWEPTRWRRDRRYFEALFRHAGEDLVLFLASHEGHLAGFRLLGCRGPVVMDLYLSTLEAFEPRHVGPLLVAEPLAWCQGQGHAVFDFLPSGSLDGVRAYKASFGAVPLGLTRATYTSWWGRSLATLREAVAARSA